MRNLSSKTRLVMAAILLAILNLCVILAQPGPTKIKATTSCLIETRKGQKSCWGIVIAFEEAQFKKRSGTEHLKVFEAKHGHNITSLMTWHVSPNGKQLTIKFKPGLGGFGSGNTAEITLYKTAFAVPPKDFPEHVTFTQDTDIK